MRKQKKKVSFVFEIIFLILAMITGMIMLGFHFISGPFLKEGALIGIIVLEALCFSILVAVSFLIHKIKKQEMEDDDE